MKKYPNIIILVVMALLATTTLAKENPNGMTLDRVEILSISTRIDLLDYKPQGSIKGGTIIYLKALGFNNAPSENLINVGPYECKILDNGISGDLISCMTSEAWDPLRRWALDVELHVKNKV